MLYRHSSTAMAPARRARTAFVLITAAVLAAGAFQGCSGDGGNTSDLHPFQALMNWNRIAIDASGFDHSLAPAEQPGPGRSARAMAIVHIAMFEVLIAAEGGFQSYTGLAPNGGDLSQSAAIAQAARDTLVALFPGQTQTFDDALAADLALIEDGSKKNGGIALGHASASAILGMRFNDGSQIPEPLVNADFVCSDQPGFWRQDPVFPHPLALGAHWNQVLPFVMTTADQFRAPAPPAMTDLAYTIAFDEVKALGGDGIVTPTTRTPDQTVAGIYWAYDGAPSLGSPPRLYNQIAVHIGQQMNLQVKGMARLLALVNVGMADAGVACWESKYFYELWRPVCGIRESDPGTGPTGIGDGNAATVGDVNFTPLGAPASNTMGTDFTPPFPAYPSGHAAFGGVLFQVLRRVFNTDNIPFTFVSDEFNGVTTDASGNPRPLLPRSFQNLSQAEEENGQSRIYLGVHWAYDKYAGIEMGRSVGNWVFDNMYQPN